MIDYWEVVRRALTGPLCSEAEFDMDVFVPILRKAVREHEIRYDAQNPIPADDDLADRVFQAAVDVYASTGTYVFGTERIVRFDRAEILEAVANAGDGAVLGQGRDERVLRARRPEDPFAPWVSIGAGGAPVSDEVVFASLMRAYARDPQADSLTTPALVSYDGITIQAGTPLELEGAIRTVKLAKEAARQVGRPGLCLANAIATAASCDATVAGSQFGLSSSDVWEIASIPELKVDLGTLNKVAYVLSVNGNVWDGTSSILGGWSGGPEGTAVTIAANYLAALFVKRACAFHPYPMHFVHRCTSERSIMWAYSLATQAVTRNCRLPTVNLQYTAMGPGTAGCLYEAAAVALAATASGGSIEAIGTASNMHLDHLSPVEPIFAGEVAKAAAGLSRASANEMAKRLLSLYEGDIANPDPGQKYQDCCDVASGRPKREWRTVYDQVKGEVASMGLVFTCDPLGQS